MAYLCRNSEMTRTIWTKITHRCWWHNILVTTHSFMDFDIVSWSHLLSFWFWCWWTRRRCCWDALTAWFWPKVSSIWWWLKNFIVISILFFICMFIIKFQKLEIMKFTSVGFETGASRSFCDWLKPRKLQFDWLRALLTSINLKVTIRGYILNSPR